MSTIPAPWPHVSEQLHVHLLAGDVKLVWGPHPISGHPVLLQTGPFHASLAVWGTSRPHELDYSPDLAPLLQAAPDLYREVFAARAARDKAEGNYRFMVENAASNRLDGYRELGARAAEAENQLDAMRGANRILEGELKEARAAVEHREVLVEEARALLVEAFRLDLPFGAPRNPRSLTEAFDFDKRARDLVARLGGVR